MVLRRLSKKRPLANPMGSGLTFQHLPLRKAVVDDAVGGVGGELALLFEELDVADDDG